jgi:hypothetical protein
MKFSTGYGIDYTLIAGYLPQAFCGAGQETLFTLRGGDSL